MASSVPPRFLDLLDLLVSSSTRGSGGVKEKDSFCLRSTFFVLCMSLFDHFPPNQVEHSHCRLRLLDSTFSSHNYSNSVVVQRCSVSSLKWNLFHSKWNLGSFGVLNALSGPDVAEDWVHVDQVQQGVLLSHNLKSQVKLSANRFGRE